MNARATRLAAAAVAAALLTAAAVAAVVTSSSSAAAPLTGSITKTYSANQCDNQQPAPPHTLVPPACWYCTGPVDLDSVTITIDQQVVEEGARLGPGCTGRIGKLTIVTPGSERRGGGGGGPATP